MKVLLERDFDSPSDNVLPGPINIVGITESKEGWEVTHKGQYKVRVFLAEL